MTYNEEVAPTRKSEEDRELEDRVRAWIRFEIVERGISQNEMERRLGLTEGRLSKILTSTRGFKSGLILLVIRRIGIRAAQLILEDPPGGTQQSPASTSPAAGQPGRQSAGGRARHAS